MTLLKADRRKLLNTLIYERVKGRPIYYRGYKRVLKGELPPEAIMGSSEIQAVLIMLIASFLQERLGKDFIIAVGELGFKISDRTWRNLDLAVFKISSLKKLGHGFTSSVPEVVIEVDTKADLSGYGNVEEYIYEKTQDLLNAGVKKVVWILTRPKKVLVAEIEKKWITQDVCDDIEVMEGISMNLCAMIKERGLEVEGWSEGS